MVKQTSYGEHKDIYDLEEDDELVLTGKQIKKYHDICIAEGYAKCKADVEKIIDECGEYDNFWERLKQSLAKLGKEKK